jgi:hypothetical protein
LFCTPCTREMASEEGEEERGEAEGETMREVDVG